MISSLPNRVLITGVSNPLGAEVARRLAPQVPFLFGCDVADPVSALEEMDFVHADTRHAVIAKLIRQLRIDTVRAPGGHGGLRPRGPRAPTRRTSSAR